MISDGTRWNALKASNYQAAALREEYDLLSKQRIRFAPMKFFPAIVATCLLTSLVSAPAAEPSKENEREQQQLLALAKEVQGQQAMIADNQTKIDAKLATIAEALRQARIYSTRGR